MFKEIITISKNYAIVKFDNIINDDLLNIHVVFEENDKKILGEIEEIVNNEAKIYFLGEFDGDNFFDGIIRRPSINASVRIINNNELAILTNYNDEKAMLLGLAPVYNDSPVKVNINALWSNHLAIIGNSGTGKTFAMTRIIQNLFSMQNYIPFNSIFFIFNNTNEYYNTFNNINKFNFNFNYKKISTDNNKENTIKLPLWLLSIDDYANLFEVNDYFQINLIEKMIKYACLFNKKDDVYNKYKNHLLAKTIISILYSNEDIYKKKEQIISILSKYNTKEINFDIRVSNTESTRNLIKCFDINNQERFVENDYVLEYMNRFIDSNLDFNLDYSSTYLTLDDLKFSLYFILISEELLLNENTYKASIYLKNKLDFIISSPLKKYFEYENYISINDFISNLILIGNNKRAQIINFVFEDIDSSFSKLITELYCRILFNFAKRLPENKNMPFNIILDGASNYIESNSIFNKIINEGNKYGIAMDLIIKNINDISEDILSHCNNFLIFKINNNYIENIIPNINKNIIENQKSKKCGYCTAIGKMVKIPLNIKIQMPNNLTTTSNYNLFDKWMIQWKK